jgi:hypothetical protein
VTAPSPRLLSLLDVSSETVYPKPAPRRVARACSGALLALALFTASCDDTPTGPTTNSPVTETFGSNIQPGGALSRSFVTAQSGTVSVTFLTISATDVEMAIRLGTTDSAGRGCTITNSVTSKADPVNALISTTLPAGNYCVQIADVGNLTGLASFVITFVRP